MQKSIIDGLNAILEKEDIVWGIADVSKLASAGRYLRAIVVAQKYSEFLSYQDYNEEKYNKVLLNTKKNVDRKIDELKSFFELHDINSYIPPLSQTSEEELVAPISFKYLAVKAGIGWIGKSSLLVTNKFGPRVRLGVILVDYQLSCGTEVKKSYCGVCSECVNACPWNFIKNKTWDTSMKRDELIDFHGCNRERSKYIHKSKGRKHNCGYCLLVCPYGLK